MSLSEREQWARWLGVPVDASPMQVCEAFSRAAPALAPAELAEWPLYCLPTSALPAGFATTCKWRDGWYNDLAYFWVRDSLASDRCPGPVLIVHDHLTPEQRDRAANGAKDYYTAKGEDVSLEELQEFIAPQKPISGICGILVHELAHAIDSLAAGEFQCWAEAARITPKATARLERQYESIVESRQQQSNEPPPQLDSHGLRFTRIMAHLDSRLRARGVCHKAVGTAGERFGQRPYDECFAALNGEPAQMRNKSFEKILATPMPVAFAACSINETIKGGALPS